MPSRFPVLFLLLALLAFGGSAYAQTDLVVAKFDAPDPVTAGTALVYQIAVQNVDAATTNVVVTDVLPAGVSFVSTDTAAAPSFVCLEAAGTVTCTAAAFAVATEVIVVNVTVDPSATGTIDNTATVTGADPDPTPANNTSTVSTTVVTQADLSVTKVDSPDPVLQGGVVTYTVSISNAGPSTATNVTLTDTIPAGVTVTGSSAPAEYTCSNPDAVTILCQGGLLLPGETDVFTLELTLDPGTTGSISNTALVSSDVTDLVAGNNSDTEPTAITPAADLTVTKADSPDPVLQGGVVTYTVTITNNGPATATNVTLTDTIPAGVTVTGSTAPAGYTCSNPDAVTIQCTGGTLLSGASDVFTLELTLDPATTGSISNTAAVSSDVADPVAGNNSDTEPTAITTSADLSITKTDSPDPVLQGGVVTYTVTITNNGPGTATNVTLTDTIPAGVTVTGSSAPAGYTCSNPDAVTILCSGGTLASGASDVFTLELTLDPGTTGSIDNSATVTSDASDPVPANNSVVATTAITSTADLSVSKTDAPDPVLAGGNLTYTITVANAGPSAAASVVLDDTVPTETTFVSMTAPAGFTCTTPAVGGTGAIQCTGATLASAANAVFTLVVAVDDPATGPISNTATVSSATVDTNAANDTATATTTIAPPVDADVAITKTAGAGPFAPGDNIPYTITVTNNGPASATNVTVVDALPAGTTFVSATPSVGSCSGTGPVTCTPGTLASGATATIALVVTSPATAGTFVNNVTVTATETDPNAANNAASASATTVAPAVADLSIVKVAGAGPFVAGGDISYTITVTNNGPGSATNVTVVDTLPAGTTFVSATPSAGACSGTGPVTCTLGTFANGGTATIELIVTSPATAGTFVNNATVSATQTDPTPANNTTSASATTIDAAAIPFTSPWVLLLLAATLAVVGATRFRI